MPSWPLGDNQKQDQRLSPICDDDDHDNYDMHYDDDYYYYLLITIMIVMIIISMLMMTIMVVIKRRITNSALFATNSLPVDRRAILMNSDQLN